MSSYAENNGMSFGQALMWLILLAAIGAFIIGSVIPPTVIDNTLNGGPSLNNAPKCQDCGCQGCILTNGICATCQWRRDHKH